MSPKPQRRSELCLLRWSPRTPGTVCVWSRASFPRKRDGGVEQWARLTPGVPPVGGGVLAVRRRCPDGRKVGGGARLPETAGGQSPPLASPDTGCVSAWGRGGAGRAAWSEDFHQPVSISSVLPTHGSSVRFDPFPVSLQFGIRFFRRSRKMWSFSWVPCWWCWCWSSGWAAQLYFPSLFAARPRLSGDIVPIVAAKRG